MHPDGDARKGLTVTSLIVRASITFLLSALERRSAPRALSTNVRSRAVRPIQEASVIARSFQSEQLILRDTFFAANHKSSRRRTVDKPFTAAIRENLRTLRALAEKSANQGSVSHFRRAQIKQRALEDSRRIRGMALPGIIC